MENADLHIVLDAVEEPVLLLGHNGTILHVNGPGCELLGDGLEGLPFVRALRQPEALRCVNSVLDGVERASTEIQLRAPHSSTYRLTAVHLGGENTAVAVTLTDMTPLLQAAQMRSDFVANVSHELRSPLTTLSGLIETLQNAAKDDPEARTRFLDIMSREAGRMDRLIDDLLSLSQVEAEERVRPTEDVDLARITHSVVNTMKERPDGQERAFRLSGLDDAVMVSGDPDQLTQVIYNLLENATKYSRPGGTIVLDALKRPSVPGFASAAWELLIADEGEGIAQEHLPRLTERFYRVDSGRSRQMGGTGLGLAIVKHILSRHRGRLSIRSDVGNGTTVSILLPAQQAD